MSIMVQVISGTKITEEGARESNEVRKVHCIRTRCRLFDVQA